MSFFEYLLLISEIEISIPRWLNLVPKLVQNSWQKFVKMLSEIVLIFSQKKLLIFADRRRLQLRLWFEVESEIWSRVHCHNFTRNVKWNQDSSYQFLFCLYFIKGKYIKGCVIMSELLYVCFRSVLLWFCFSLQFLSLNFSISKRRRKLKKLQKLK